MYFSFESEILQNGIKWKTFFLFAKDLGKICDALEQGFLTFLRHFCVDIVLVKSNEFNMSCEYVSQV